MRLGTGVGYRTKSYSKKGDGGGFKFQFLLAFIRGISLGLGVWLTIDRNLGAIFGLFSWLALSSSYFLHFAPSDIYAGEKAGLNNRKFWAAVCRGLAVIFASLLAGLVVHAQFDKQLHAVWVGLCVGVASFFVSIFVPVIEQWAEELPAQKLGMVGTILFMLGFCLQAVPYVVASIHSPTGMNKAFYDR